MKKVFERFLEKSSSYIPLKLGYECGLRLDETFGLCWEDLDLATKVIFINGQVQWFQDNERTTIDKVRKNSSMECGNGYWYFSHLNIILLGLLRLVIIVWSFVQRKEKARQDKGEEYYGISFRRHYADSPLSFDYKSNMHQDIPNRIRTQETCYPIHFVCIRENGTFISPRTMQC